MSDLIHNENYYVVQGWMRNELNLKGASLEIYAIIYGFSQVSHQKFTASINYLCEWIGASRPTVINALKNLTELGYLTKTSKVFNGVTYNEYVAVEPKNFTRGKEILPEGVKKFDGGSKETLHNNIDNNIAKKDTEKSLSKDKEAKASYKDIYDAEENKFIRDALVKFVNSCRGKNYTPKVNTVAKWAGTLREFCGTDSSLAMKTVDHCISEGWKAIYPLKGYKPVESTQPVSDEAVDENGNKIVF